MTKETLLRLYQMASKLCSEPFDWTGYTPHQLMRYGRLTPEQGAADLRRKVISDLELWKELGGKDITEKLTHLRKLEEIIRDTLVKN